MKKYYYVILIVLFFLSFLTGVLILIQRSAIEGDKEYISKKDKIAVVDLTGEIYFADVTQRFLKKDVEYYTTKIKSLMRRKDIKGILLRINSPGGSVAAVQYLYNQIKKLRQQYNKPVVCYVPELCASGGYYVAVACDKIICAQGSVVGSVGVLLQVGNISGLLKKIGVNVEIIKSSKFKDIGSIYREMLPEERQVFESLVNTAYEQFISAIIEGRKLYREEVMKFADGRIFIGTQAVELKMVDGIGDEDDAIEEIKKMASIKGKVEIIRERVSPFDIFLQTFGESLKKTDLLSKIPTEKKFRFEYIFE